MSSTSTCRPARSLTALNELGIRDNTIIFYIFGDNGSSAEGQKGSISELLAQNQIPNTIQQQLAALETLGGLDAIGGPKTDNMYHAGWAWAGDTPLQVHQARRRALLAARATRWSCRGPKVSSRTRRRARSSITPTISSRRSMRSSTLNRRRSSRDSTRTRLTAPAWSIRSPTRKRRVENTRQYFDNNGSRGIYHDGWYACTFGPVTPWLTVSPGLATWDANKDVWELYNLSNDFSQAEDLAAKEPQRLAEMKELFLEEAEENKVFPIGGALLRGLIPLPESPALISIGIRCDDHADARVHCPRPRTSEQSIDH